MELQAETTRPCRCRDCETDLQVTFSLLLECLKRHTAATVPLWEHKKNGEKSQFLTVESSCGVLSLYFGAEISKIFHRDW